ncbi:hypothetical protein [Deinococcus aestuarii]|uniref:hypothetical protein n=1 Tax=Deinococcus aestuarii TaxID=2774531 RepID=UPI001C0D74A0|nr:hypothetical protein [Deinococcus aestuarii]
MRVQVGEWTLEVRQGDQPFAHLLLLAGGVLEAFGDLEAPTYQDDQLLCVGVGKSKPAELVVVQRFESHGGIFGPGVLIVPETGLLFLGAGTRLLAYDLNEPTRLWEDFTEHGFLAWDRIGGVVLMSAELELAAWTTAGRKLWTTFVEPPWSYSRDGDDLELDVMGNVSHFSILTGP